MPAWITVPAAIAGLTAFPLVVRSVLAEQWNRGQQRQSRQNIGRICARAVTNGGQR
jgi:hypothetical protein